MSIQDLGSLGEFVAAIATIATLIYLALQIRQNTQATKDQSTRSLVLANSEATGDIARDGELADILMRGAYDRGALNAAEKFRFNCFFFSYYNQIDYAYERYLHGKMEAEPWKKIAKEIPVYIGSPGIRAWWSEDKIRFSPAFVDFVEGQLNSDVTKSKLPSVPSPDEVENTT